MTSRVSFGEDHGFTFDNEQFKQTLNRICKISTTTLSPVVSMSFKDGRLTITSGNDFTHVSSKETMNFTAPQLEVKYDLAF